MTPQERAKLVEEIAQQILTITPSSFWPADDLQDMARAALAIVERAIRKDCAEIVNKTGENLQNAMCRKYDTYVAGEVCEFVCEIARKSILEGKPPEALDYEPEW